MGELTSYLLYVDHCAQWNSAYDVEEQTRFISLQELSLDLEERKGDKM